MRPAEDAAAPREKGWLRRLTRAEWSVLGVTMLFWMFDGYETFALIITGPESLREPLSGEDLPDLSRYFGYLLAIGLAGWLVGGVVGGFAGDRFGLRRTMIGAIGLRRVIPESPKWAGQVRMSVGELVRRLGAADLRRRLGIASVLGLPETRGRPLPV